MKIASAAKSQDWMRTSCAHIVTSRRADWPATFDIWRVSKSDIWIIPTRFARNRHSSGDREKRIVKRSIPRYAILSKQRYREPRRELSTIPRPRSNLARFPSIGESPAFPTGVLRWRFPGPVLVFHPKPLSTELFSTTSQSTRWIIAIV